MENECVSMKHVCCEIAYLGIVVIVGLEGIAGNRSTWYLCLEGKEYWLDQCDIAGLNVMAIVSANLHWILDTSDHYMGYY